jgi:TatD DNase family protein
MLFDSHCHLTADAFDDDRDEVVDRARSAGVERLVTIASNAGDAEQALQFVADRPGIWTTAGVHPHEAEAASPAELARVRSLLGHPKMVAVGECGLDFFYDNAPRDVQFEAFRCQVALAGEFDLPLVVHCREADDEMIAELQGAAGEVAGVLHCFSGGDDLLECALDRGWYISFSGMVTFRRFAGAEQVRRVPGDRLLVETDAPYLAPVPKRGRRNEPELLVHTARTIAEMRGQTFEEIARTTTANAERFYSIPPGVDDT